MARSLTLRYTMKVNMIGGGVGDATLEGAVDNKATLAYRIAGDGVPDTNNGVLTLRDGCHVAQGRPSGARQPGRGGGARGRHDLH